MLDGALQVRQEHVQLRDHVGVVVQQPGPAALPPAVAARGLRLHRVHQGPQAAQQGLATIAQHVPGRLEQRVHVLGALSMDA